MKVFDRIYRWAQGLPDWQSDAVRRILIQGDLTKEDRKALLAIVKAKHGIVDPDSPAPSPKLLQESDLPTTLDSSARAVLKSMREIRNVNALASGQTLKFAPKGVTIIYGENASGKSGYSRILKKACRARGETEEILPNIFESGVAIGAAEAVFDVFIEGKDKEEKWTDGVPSPDSLAGISVFDSKAARFFVDENNDVEYIPYGLDVFQKLGNLCEEFREQFQGELKARTVESLPKELEDTKPLTEVGKLLSELSHETKLSDVETLASLTDEEKERLQKVQEMIAEIEANNPRILAANQRRFKDRVEKINDAIRILDKGLSPEACQSFKGLHVRMQETAEAAKVASQDKFKDQPLTGVGSGPWKDLFEAARRYSESKAYPGQSFPVTGDDSRCVLCFQDLDDEAKERLMDFDKFIKQDTEREAVKAAKTLKQEWDKLCSLPMDIQSGFLHVLSPETGASSTIFEIAEADTGCGKVLLGYLVSVVCLVEVIRHGYEKGKWRAFPALSATPEPLLNTLMQSLEKKAKELDAATEPKEQKRLREEFQKLSERSALSTHKSSVIKHIDTLKFRQCLEECIKSINTRKITNEGKKLAGDILTKPLRDALNEEFAALGIANIKLELASAARKGTPSHALKLKSAIYKKIDVSSVLSEGEQRAVSIASFLAEVRTLSNSSSLVFDDPVCSLDHKWRHRVAKRLVKEGSERQIIIFTHDIVLLLAVQNEAAEQQIPLLPRNIRCGPECTGICEPEHAPWHAMKVRQRIGHIRNLLQDAKKKYRDDQTEEYRKLALSCRDLLRKSWEKAIEEVLLNNSIERFGPEIKTKSLRGVSVTDDDYVKIDRAMSKLSASVHDEAPALNQPTPTPDEIREDIDELDSFVTEINSRRTKTQEQRKKLLEAPGPRLSVT